MKISFLDDEPEIFPMQYGGKARTIIALAKKFACLKNVDKVTIMSRSIKDARDKFKWGKINFIKLDGYNIVGKIIDECNNADIINVHASSFTFPYIENCKAIIVNHLHDVIFATCNAGSHLDKAIGGNWDAIISPSPFATNVLKNITTWNNLSERIYTIPRAMDGNVFYKLSPKIVISKIKKIVSNSGINCGRYPIIFFPHRASANKGEIFLPKICDLLHKKYPNSLILTTLGKQYSFNASNVVNLDWIPTEYMKYFYSISDITISFSFLPESFSQVCLESLACGTPVLTFKFGNLSDLSKIFPAIKNCEPDIVSIFTNIVNILENKKQIKKDLAMSQKIIKRDYNPSKIAKMYLEAYTNILSNKTKLKSKSLGQIKKKGAKYFASPALADYGNNVYLFKEERLQKFRVNNLEQDILKLCSQGEERALIGKQLKNLIKNLSDKQIINLS